MEKPAVYILANKQNGTLYTGVTSNLIARIYEHKNDIKSGFASKHGCKMLVYYQCHDNMNAAILEEKRIKGGNRKANLKLIEIMNPEWLDLYDDLL